MASISNLWTEAQKRPRDYLNVLVIFMMTVMFLVTRRYSLPSIDVIAFNAICLLSLVKGPRSEHPASSVQGHPSRGKHHPLRLRWNAGRCTRLHLSCLGSEFQLPLFLPLYLCTRIGTN